MQFPNPVPSAHHSTLFGVSCAHWSAIRTILHPTHRHTTHTTLIVKDIACIFWLWMLNFSNWCSNFLMSSTVINRQAPQIYLIAIVRHFFLSIIYFYFFLLCSLSEEKKIITILLFAPRTEQHEFRQNVKTIEMNARGTTWQFVVLFQCWMPIFGWLNFWFQFNIFE